MVLELVIFISLAALNAAAIGVGGWLVLHAERRNAWRGRLRAALQAVDAFWPARMIHAKRRAEVTGAVMQSTVRTAWGYVAGRRRVAIAAVTIMLVPVALAVSLTSFSQLEGYEDMPAESDPVVVALLQGEQLVPPPPLPPEVFTTTEVEAIRQQLAGASREWQALDTEFRRRLLIVYQLMARHGYQMALLEGYRSPERQALLARLGPHVTNAGAFQSLHQYGLAADSAFFRNGKLVISEKDPWAMAGYRLYGEYAESVGLIWGGRWRMMDFGHVELRRNGTSHRH